MWLRLLRPDVLFLLGTLQALAPFLFYRAGLLPELTIFHVNYLAALIWTLGYASFWIGTRLIPRQAIPSERPDVPISFRTMKLCLALLSFAGLLEIVGLTRVYGGVPLLMFAKGTASVNETNRAEAASGFGQIGAAFLTSSMIFSALSLLAIKARLYRRSLALWIILPALVATTLIIFNGKRQGLVMYIVIVAVAATLAMGSPFRTLDAIIGRRKFSGLSTLVGCVLIIVIFLAFASFASLRNNGAEGSTTAEVGAYYVYPMMGLSGLCNEAGFGPFEFKPLGLLKSFIPAKLSPPSSWIGTEIPRFEPTAGEAFYDRLQWDIGLPGLILFPLLCGAFSQWMYYLAFRRYAALLTYSFVAWSLFSAAIYNHFLELMFFPVPVAIIWTLSTIMREAKALNTLADRQAQLRLAK